MGQTGQIGSKIIFFYFLKFGSLGKTCKKNFVTEIWAKWAKIGPQIRFFVIFSKVWSISIPGNCIRDSLEDCLTTRRGKTHGKNSGGLKLGPKLYFLDIAQDRSLGQCITSSRVETFQKNLRPKLGPK